MKGRGYELGVLRCWLPLGFPIACLLTPVPAAGAEPDCYAQAWGRALRVSPDEDYSPRIRCSTVTSSSAVDYVLEVQDDTRNRRVVVRLQRSAMESCAASDSSGSVETSELRVYERVFGPNGGINYNQLLTAHARTSLSFEQGYCWVVGSAERLAFVVGAKATGESKALSGSRRIVSVHVFSPGERGFADESVTIWEGAYLVSAEGRAIYRSGYYRGFLQALAEEYDALGPWWADLNCLPKTADSGHVKVFLLLDDGEVREHIFRGVCQAKQAVEKVLRLLCGFKTAGFTTPSGRPLETAEFACRSITGPGG